MSLLSPVPSKGNSCSILLRIFWLVEINKKNGLMSSLHMDDLKCEEHKGWWKIIYSSYAMSVPHTRAQR